MIDRFDRLDIDVADYHVYTVDFPATAGPDHVPQLAVDYIHG